MTTNNISVASLTALTLLHVAQLEDGTEAWIVAEGVFFALQKNSAVADDSYNVISPAAGAPIAGAANARWIRQTTIKATFAADASVTTNAAQYLASGSRVVSSVVALAGAIVVAPGTISWMAVEFTRTTNATQTGVFSLEISTDNGATFGAVTGATTTAIALGATGGVSTLVSFAPVAVAEGNILRAVFTPSAGLTNAILNVLVAVR